jgi:predicted nucleic acid-binding protein
VITYVDTSVILRLAFNEPNHLAGWQGIQRRCTSRLARVEALRTLDRRFAQRAMSLEEFAHRRAFVLALLDGIDQAAVSEGILQRVENAFPTPLRTLDAIHLATALALAAREGVRLATHDAELATAATSVGLDVVGV